MAMKKKEKKIIGKTEFKKQMGGRTAFLFFIFVLAFVILIGRLGYIVWYEGNNFRQKVLSQAIEREGDSLIAYKRGAIKDRNGIVLASTSQVFRLIFDPKLFLELKENQKKKTIDFMVEKRVRTRDEIDKILISDKEKHYLVLEEKVKIEDFYEIKEAIDQNKVKALFYEMENIREYPYPNLAPELIGFVKGDNIGQGGIEEFYNDILIGEVGRKYGILNSQSIAVDKEVSATDGYQVMLNLDYSIQKYITDAMTDYLKNHNPKSVTIIVADPRNMNILGLKSYPSFSQDSPYNIPDLELPADVEIVEKDIAAIVLQRKKELLKEKIEKGLAVAPSKDAKDSQTGQAENTESANQQSESQPNQEAPKIPVMTVDDIKDEEVITPEERSSMRKNLLLQNRWKNIALTNGYEPGSIFKAVTYAAAAEEDRINPENFYYCKGGTQVANYFIRCHKHSGHGAETAEQGLSNSCNVVFMEMASKIGRDMFYNYQHKFGFGAITGIDLSGETSQRKNIYSKKELNEVQLATSSFGQGFNVTPIQMITAFSALINGGYLYEPHVVNKVFDSEGNLFEVKDKTLVRQVISEETSLRVRRALRGVVDEGTGRTAKIAGYEIGGKTATSEKQPRGNGKYTVSFMGFAPIENPEVITLVIVDEPEGAYQDSRIPALIFRNCMENIMPYLHIFKAETEVDTETKK